MAVCVGQILEHTVGHKGLTGPFGMESAFSASPQVFGEWVGGGEDREMRVELFGSHPGPCVPGPARSRLLHGGPVIADCTRPTPLLPAPAAPGLGLLVIGTPPLGGLFLDPTDSFSFITKSGGV